MAVNGQKNNPNPLKRKFFISDIASHYSFPKENKEPTTARGRRRRENGKRTRKPPEMLIKGQAHRPHSHPSKLSGPTIKGHLVTESHAKLVALTRAYRRSH